MKILHISDIHCDLETLCKVMRLENFDLVVVSGDIECVDVAERLGELKGKLVAVTGNLDDISIRRTLDKAGLLIDGRVKEVLGFKFAGIGGIDYRSDLAQLQAKAKGLDIDVLVTHYPPKGVLDRTFMGVRIGLSDIKQLALALRPSLHLFGHVHESRGVERYGDRTIAVNPGPVRDGYYAVIKLERGLEPLVELKRVS